MKHPFLSIVLGAVIAHGFAIQAQAASGSDDSSNYGSWTSGSTGGTGFGPWELHSDAHGDGFAGLEKAFSDGTAQIMASDNSFWKLYAIGFTAFPSGDQAWEEATAYREFLTPLKSAGDQFAVSFEMQFAANNGVGNPGQMGFALRNGNTTGSGNRNAGARLQVYLDGSTNYVIVEDSLGPRVTTVTNDGPGVAYDCEVTLTGPNTYSLSITRYDGFGGLLLPVIVTGNLAGSGDINSLALFNWNFSDGIGVNSDAYFNNLFYTNQAPDVCPPISLRRLQNLQQDVGSTQAVVAVGGTAPYTYAVTTGSLPAGMNLSAEGVLSGTPTAVESTTFTITATDDFGCTGSRTYTVGVYGTGTDNSLNYSSGTWVNGANGGTGFAPWEFHSENHGSGFAGLELAAAGDVNIQDGSGNVWKQYAVFGDGWEEAIAYRRFKVPLGQAGDGLSLSFGLQNGNGGVGNPGQVGFALRNGNYTGSGAHDGRARLQVYLQGNTNVVVVEDALGPRPTSVPNNGPGSAYDCAVTLTGPDSYSVTLTPYDALGSNGAPVLVTGTLAGSGPIDSLSMFNWNFANGNVNSDAFFNNLAYTGTAPLITNNVTFQVDLSAQILAGNFNPVADAVEIRGSFNGWSGGIPLSPTVDDIYVGTVPIVGAAGSGQSYKFVYTNLSGVVFESDAPKFSTPDTGYANYNRFLHLPNEAATVLPVVYFDDVAPNDLLPVNMVVTFSVDMNGAVTTEGTNFTIGMDRVWINGEFIPWYPWYEPLNPVSPPVQYELSHGGGGIYSVAVNLPAGGPIAFAYKYGVGIASLGDFGPRDNEAPVGQDHYRVVRRTAGGTYAMPLDTFGGQYQEPFFSPATPEGGSLRIGVPSGGSIPVSWLGRPGARLQSAASVAGPWTDHPGTDGTNWTAGISTTNGFMSVTNWPLGGGAVFRLVKP